MAARPVSALPARSTRYPPELRRSWRPSRISASSSTTRILALSMDGFLAYREFEAERSAFARSAADLDGAAVLLHDAVADRKPQARSFAGGLGGEEGVENTVEQLAGDAHAGVGDLDIHGSILCRGADLDHAAVGHGVARVHEQVQKHLLEAVGRAEHGGQVLAQVFHHAHARQAERMRD